MGEKYILGNEIAKDDINRANQNPPGVRLGDRTSLGVRFSELETVLFDT